MGTKKLMVGLSLFALLSLAFAGTGCSADLDGDDEDGEVDDEEIAVSEDALVDRSAGGCASLCRPDNCVGYARCRTKNDGGKVLPGGMTTFGDKLRVANSASGRKGCVAMIRTSRVYGHAAYVEDSWVSGGVRRYRISEASWAHKYQCGVRTGSKKALGIAEFWCP